MQSVSLTCSMVARRNSSKAVVFCSGDKSFVHVGQWYSGQRGCLTPRQSVTTPPFAPIIFSCQSSSLKSYSPRIVSCSFQYVIRRKRRQPRPSSHRRHFLESSLKLRHCLRLKLTPYLSASITNITIALNRFTVTIFNTHLPFCFATE